jgi:hypothetical protein
VDPVGSGVLLGIDEAHLVERDAAAHGDLTSEVRDEPLEQLVLVCVRAEIGTRVTQEEGVRHVSPPAAGPISMKRPYRPSATRRSLDPGWAAAPSCQSASLALMFALSPDPWVNAAL